MAAAVATRRGVAPAAVAAKRPAPAPGPLGTMPVLAPVAALGVLLVALGDNAARTGSGAAEPLFWAGLVAIYAPIAFRLLSGSASRSERIALVALLGVALFLVKVLYAPIGFVFYDELGWWRATHDLLQTGHPFSANPLVVTTPGFPGLDLFTAPLAQLARLSIFHAGTIAVGFVRTVFLVALFLFFERATRSARKAGIAVAVYACNPSFLYFNAQFAYESLALLLGIALLLLAARWAGPENDPAGPGARGLVVAMVVLAGALTVTHHMTSYAVLALLIGWAVLSRLGEPAAGAAPRDPLLQTTALPAIVLGVTASAWFAFVAGGVTITELGDVLAGAIRSVVHLLLGVSGPRKPFEAGAQSNSWPARLVAIASVVGLLAILPAGFRKAWRTSPPDPLLRLLAIVALLYVVTLGLRLTPQGTETSQRSSEFVFLGLAPLAALVLGGGGRSPLRRRLALTALGTVVFAGGLIVGEPPQGRQPGPFLVGAERRSVTAQGLAAAEFAAAELPPGSRILADHTNAMLMGSYGGLDPVTREVDGVPIARVFLDRTFDRRARRVVRDSRIAYIVVDRRLSRSVPIGGYYFTREEPGAFERSTPVDRAALAKFSKVAGLAKVYGSGPIAIYDTAGLRAR